ncbi:MAG: hypothetical protein M3P53_00045 [Actinomycetota bacterium]|nr:hypothetical protein [Actinomycetota bacterium]
MLGLNATIGMNILLKAFEYWRRGETKYLPVQGAPRRAGGGGLLGGQPGFLAHHLHMDKGKIMYYQIKTPSTPRNRSTSYRRTALAFVLTYIDCGCHGVAS